MIFTQSRHHRLPLFFSGQYHLLCLSRLFSLRALASDRLEKQQTAFVLLALYPYIGYLLTGSRRHLKKMELKF